MPHLLSWIKGWGRYKSLVSCHHTIKTTFRTTGYDILNASIVNYV